MRTAIPIWILSAVAVQAAEPLGLAEAVARAVAKHPSVEAARASLRAANEKLPEAKAGFKPRVDFQESWVRSNNPVFVFGSLLTQRQFGPQNFAIDSLNRPDALNQFQSLVMAEQVLWDGGRTRKSVEMAELGQRAAAISVKQIELALASRTARAYLEWQLTQAAIPVARQALEAAEADLKQVEAIRDAGRATAADALSVKVHRVSMEEQLMMRTAEERIARRVLNELIGAPDASEFALTTNMKNLPVAEAAADRPAVEQSKLQLHSAGKQIELAKLAWMPQVGLRLGFEADRQRFENRGGAN